MARHQGEGLVCKLYNKKQKPGEIHSRAGFTADDSIDPKPAASLLCIRATDYEGEGMKLDIG